MNNKLLELETIDIEEYIRLGQFQADPCISVYIPTFKEERDRYDGNRIRMKNALQEVTQALEKRGLNPPEIDRLLSDARSTLNNDVFWAHQHDGLAVLISPESTRMIPLTHIEEPQVYVDRQFILRPLLPLVTNAYEGFLLAISQNQAAFYHIHKVGLDQIDIDEMPTSLAEALAFDDPENRLQSHSATASTEKGAIFHGHHPKDEHTSQLERYCQMVGESIERYLANERNDYPLVLAGPKELLAIFREVLNSPNPIVDREVEGNVDEWAKHDLHAESWQIVEDFHQAQRYAAARRYKDLHHADLTASTIQDVVRAAFFGQIDTLFVVTAGTLYGHYDEAAGRVATSEDGVDTVNERDLLDLAALKTLENSGSVIPLDAPAEPPAAAILRYAIKTEAE